MSEKQLPVGFVSRMKDILGTEYEAFEEALLSSRSYGLRINPLKVSSENITELSDTWGIIDKVPWAEEGYYYNDDSRPGRSPYHEAGAYYIQEPSAMAVVQALDPKPGDVVCDLCAAPGGKTTHIAGRLDGKGTLVSNEIVNDRAKILARNVERMGITNCMVVNETPDSMAMHFPNFFDKIVVDAPCSGEGMFRKDDIAISEWSTENVELCVSRQKDILDSAALMAKPGCVMVYSTCTFEPDEDELMIADFIEKHPDWSIVSTGLEGILSSGQTKYGQEFEHVNRIWPHINKGEGHFLAKLVKNGETDRPLDAKIKSRDKTSAKKIVQFLDTELLSEGIVSEIIDESRIIINGEHVYLRPKYIADYQCKGLKIIRDGLELVTIGNKNRLEPAHALAMSLTPDATKYSCSLNDNEAIKYLHGETINIQLDIPNGSWILVTISGISMGWGKYVGGIIKNHYPKGLRINY